MSTTGLNFLGRRPQLDHDPRERNATPRPAPAKAPKADAPLPGAKAEAKPASTPQPAPVTILRRATKIDWAVEWRTQFKTVGELEQGDVRMLIDGFLPEGVTFIGGLPGEGKSLLALSIAKALTTPCVGYLFLDRFVVKEKLPVVYLIPESGARAFRARCEAFGIPDDENVFLCRTISEGTTLPLDRGALFEVIRRLKPVVVLDTFIRFSDADNENDAAQNREVMNAIFALRSAGAATVICLHHATKTSKKKGMTLESVLRGTGDIAASADAVYGIVRDDKMWNHGAGPLEIDMNCVKARDFDAPEPLRLAATRKRRPDEAVAGKSTVSIIGERGDFMVVGKAASQEAVKDQVKQLIECDPEMTLKELAEASGQTVWALRRITEDLGYTKPKGRGPWSRVQ